MQTSSSPDIIRRAAERGLEKAQSYSNQDGWSPTDDFIDIFQHIIDEAERLHDCESDFEGVFG